MRVRAAVQSNKPSLPVYRRLAAMDRISLRRKLPVRLMQDERRKQYERRLRALNAAQQNPHGRLASTRIGKIVTAAPSLPSTAARHCVSAAAR